jgi:ectoine hydroxylase-related dioxygenase (phytanoyl-CoA dioxygenase family)
VQKETAEEAVRQLLETTRLSEGELAAYVQRARSASYWESLNPDLSVAGAEAEGTIQVSPLESREQRNLLKQYANQGYLLLDSLLCDPIIDRLRACVEVLRKTSWPPIFAFVYDQAWLLARAAPLAQLLAAILGPGYQQASDVWVYFVPARTGAAGWPPHQDYPGRHHLLTVWIALSEATVANGCLYVLPKDRVPGRLMDHWPGLTRLERADLDVLLQGVRALPAPSGSALILESDIVHWGSACAEGGEPRISLALEFLAAGTEPAACELPLLDVQRRLPTFVERLQWIGKSILTYQTRSREPWMIRYASLAQRLLEQSG